MRRAMSRPVPPGALLASARVLLLAVCTAGLGLPAADVAAQEDKIWNFLERTKSAHGL